MVRSLKDSFESVLPNDRKEHNFFIVPNKEIENTETAD